MKILGLKFFLINIILFLLNCAITAQHLDSIDIETVGLKAIHLDKMDQVYYEYLDGHLKSKFANQQREYFNDFGMISSVDVNNPQKILLFYRDFQQIIILDNTLSNISKIDLEGISSGIVSLAVMSKRNDIWIYDEVLSTLIHLNQNGVVLSQSDPIYYHISNFKPLSLRIVNNLLFLSDNISETMVYDNFGQFIKLISLRCKGNYTISDSYMYCLENEILSKKGFDSKSLLIDNSSNSKEIDSIQLFNTNARNIIFINSRNEIKIEKIK